MKEAGFALLLFAMSSGSADRSAEAWSAWAAGDVDRARSEGAKLSDANERRHLLFLCALVSGEHAAALDQYEQVDPDYVRRDELDEVAVEALLHLDRTRDAAALAKRRGLASAVFLSERAARPLRVEIDGVIEIPFIEEPISSFFPGFEAAVNGHPTTAHVDTGGTYLHMSPRRAQCLGIELVAGPEGKHGTRTVTTSIGIADSLQLGPVRIANVPVVALPSLSGPQDFVIFGTNILERFLSTLDYPNKRLILSPRRSAAPPSQAALRREHLARLSGVQHELPFLLWGDHYMIARGGIDQHDGLNFFIDSGLVSLHPDGRGGLRQAAFLTTKADLDGLGVDRSGTDDGGVLELESALQLGDLSQSGHLILVREQGFPGFGGIRSHGLLSHAFLSAYAWTLDFDAYRYVFHIPTARP